MNISKNVNENIPKSIYIVLPSTGSPVFWEFGMIHPAKTIDTFTLMHPQHHTLIRTKPHVVPLSESAS